MRFTGESFSRIQNLKFDWKRTFRKYGKRIGFPVSEKNQALKHSVSRIVANWIPAHARNEVENKTEIDQPIQTTRVVD
ncbi:hypothetical protein [Leptospira stimsonii]|uniref:Uncharacterized protein n=1 Tax=Leptospira stimsonii TaxID=2202203 RepID=A0A396Z7A4_9LEPT|nr:hypothetical protein [Leptospira stimsonii]RHX89584.1 hypothetical protein DLM75_11435 [Leptospira stimsonii]